MVAVTDDEADGIIDGDADTDGVGEAATSAKSKQTALDWPMPVHTEQPLVRMVASHRPSLRRSALAQVSLQAIDRRSGIAAPQFARWYVPLYGMMSTLPSHIMFGLSGSVTLPSTTTRSCGGRSGCFSYTCTAPCALAPQLGEYTARYVSDMSQAKPPLEN